MQEFIIWLSEYLGIEKNPTATIIVSVAVFATGIIINESIKLVSRLRERKNYRFLVQTNYLILKNYLIVQSANFITFSNQIDEDNNPNFNLYVQSCSAITNFKEISYGNVYKSFFTGIENLSLIKNTRKLQAFNFLYNTLSMIQVEQERIFPILARYQDDAKPLVDKINITSKNAIESIGDLTIKVRELGSTYAGWLKSRAKIEATYYKGVRDASESELYFKQMMEYEFANSLPIQRVLTPKEFWNHHHLLTLAASEYIKLQRLFSGTKNYCQNTSDKFKSSGETLTENYKNLFGKRLN